ncbi:MAG: OmpA family protein [Kiritimatiellia bacterium]|nr:OmpA family protein [Kiritimatiellia bacterium]
MAKNRLFSVAVLVLVCALCMTSCRARKGGRRAGDNVGGTVGTTDEYGLTSRPEGQLNILTSVQYDAVMFDYDSAQIQESERPKIEAVADYLNKNTGVGVILEGHCDERGSAEYNLALGERRALAARAYLIGLGIDGENIQTKSYGEEQPVNPGHDESAWRLNRKSDFVFFQR